MSVITVGSGMEYSTIKAAVAAAHDGDTVLVQAGTYVNDFATVNANITMIGVGGMVNMVATAPVAKGIITINTDTNLTIDHFEFSGAKNSDNNGAGIRYQGGQLTVTNSYFHDNQDGLLGGGTHPDGNILIDHSEFNHNGAGDGLSHNLYIAQSHSLTVMNSYLHDAVVGHELKSRAEITTVLNNRIADYNGTSSYDIDVEKGGVVTIRGNYIQQGPNSQNPKMIDFGGSYFVPWANSSLTVEDNTIVNNLAGRAIGVMNRLSDVTATVDNNHIFGLTPTQVVVGLGDQSGNDTLAQAPTADTSHPWSASPYDTLIWKGAAANTLIGTSGHDLFAGSSGSDTFVIQKGGNSDTIAGFDDPGGNDVVQLQGYNFSSFADVQAAMTQSGSNVVVNLGNGETLTFLDKTIGSFTAADFTFSNTITSTNTGGTSGVTTTGSDLGTVHPSVGLVHPKLFTLALSGATTHEVDGNSGNNVLNGTNANDLMFGRAGADTMSGGAGNDTYRVDNAGDLVVENANQGIDTVYSSIASYTLTNNVENLTLNGTINQAGYGNALNNIIQATSGNDTLSGGDGNDILKASNGACVMTGGAGNDIFVFSKIGGLNTVTDFQPGQDLIDMRDIFKGYKTIDPLADHSMTITADGHGGTLISVDPSHSGVLHPVVDLEGTAPSSLYVGLDILFH